MYKKVKLAGIISTLILSASAYSAEMTVGFSQIGSESGWRAAETSVAKSEAQKRGITLKIADAQQKQENQIKAIANSTSKCNSRLKIRLLSEVRQKPPVAV